MTDCAPDLNAVGKIFLQLKSTLLHDIQTVKLNIFTMIMG